MLEENYPKALILSCKADDKLIELIKSLGIDIVFSAKSGSDERIADHPDLQIFPLGDNTFMASKDTYDYYSDKLGAYGVKLIIGDSPVGMVYPDDCKYNVFEIKDRFVCKKEAIDDLLKMELEKKNLSMIDQNQGYAKCMSIVFDDFVITCDWSINKALNEANIENYFVSPEGIDLDGFKSGFLGGCCGIIKSRKILFTGDINQIKDVDSLTKILRDKDIEWIYPDSRLVDLGSIIPIY